jgi:integrase
MPKLLTTAAVGRLRPHRSKRREVRDAGASGLHLVIQPSGVKSWAMRLRRPDGRPAKLTLGRVDLGDENGDDPVLGAPLTLRQARQLANSIDRQRARGKDVASMTERKRREERLRLDASRDSFLALARDFATDQMSRIRGWRAQAKLLGLSYPRQCGEPTLVAGGLAERWASLPIGEISTHMIHDAIDEAQSRAIPGTAPRRAGASDARAQHLAAAIGKLFSWAAAKRRVATNPCLGMKRPKALGARDRVLTACELRSLWRACDAIGGPFGSSVKLLMLTGARRGEVARLRWDELSEDLSVWTLPKERTKNKRPHVVPLAPMARDVITAAPRIEGCQLVFTTNGKSAVSGWSTVKVRLDAAMGNSNWRIHDIRRSVVTGMVEIGVLPHVVELVVNHVSGHKSGVAGTYNRSEMMPERRAALERWALHLAGVVAGEAPAPADLESERRRRRART